MSLLKNSILTLDSSRGRFIGGRFRLPSARLLIAGLVLVAALAAVGCTSGSYPVDIFYEQHYQQSYKSHEPPRLSGVAGRCGLLPAAAQHDRRLRYAPVRGQLPDVSRGRRQGRRASAQPVDK